MESFIISILEFFLIFPVAGLRYLLFNRDKMPFKTFLKKEDWFFNSSIGILIIATITGAVYLMIMK